MPGWTRLAWGDAQVLDIIPNEDLAAMTAVELAAYHAILDALAGR